jgi:hypothetical protein
MSILQAHAVRIAWDSGDTQLNSGGIEAKAVGAIEDTDVLRTARLGYLDRGSVPPLQGASASLTIA